MPSLAPRRNAGQQLITPYICVLPSINCTCTYMHIRHTHTENDRTGSKATWGSLYIFPLPSIFCSVCADYISSSQPNETMLKRTGHSQQGHAVTAPWATLVQVNTVSSHLCPCSSVQFSPVHRPRGSSPLSRKTLGVESRSFPRRQSPYSVFVDGYGNLGGPARLATRWGR